MSLEEAATVLAEAAAFGAGDRLALIIATFWQLATAIGAVGFDVVCDAPSIMEILV